MSEPTIAPTRPVQVIVAAVVGLAGTWLALAWWQGRGNTLPIPGVVAWASVAVIAVGVGYLTRRTRRTVVDDPVSLDPQQAVTRLLLGKTSLLAGAFLGGAYLAVALLALPGLPAPLAVERVVHGGLAVAACVAWAVLGARLENACRIPPPEGDKDADTPTR